jgi:ABC-type multidrug transport system fused ATPase/permease subunit
LFEHTLRFNLDPDNKSTDQEILALINKAALTNLLTKDPRGLDAKIHLRGDNLSSGEKQLICICRAILRVRHFAKILEKEDSDNG